jgi:GNAT superfamily N-acetyltransferase
MGAAQFGVEFWATNPRRAFYALWVRMGDDGAMTTVRPATRADATAIGRIDVECWQSAYAGLLPDKMLLDLSVAERRRVWTSQVARRPGDTIVGLDAIGRVQGFGNCGPCRDRESAFAGEIFTLYVALDHQGKGFGRALLLGLFTQHLARGLSSATVWVLRDNPSRYFYERLGGKLVRHRTLRLSGAAVEAVAYGWPDLETVLKKQARAGRFTDEG